MQLRRLLIISALAIALLPATASAQGWFFTPFVGANFGGNASFGDFDDSEDEVEKRIDTVVSIGAGVRCDDHGDDTVVAPILERLGYDLARAKTNIGLGRRGSGTETPAREMATT